ncbi:MAG: DUF2203 domain-containing protein [Gemmatimonadales bacterium]
MQESDRFFTLEEANKTLPYVRQIVVDIVDAYGRWRAGVKSYELVAADSRGDLGETDEQVSLREEVDRIARQINEYLEELSKVGCVFKGFDDGLVDFRSRLADKEICLCWKLGEPEILYWHEPDEGFAGRKSIEPEPVHKGTLK